MQAVRNSPYTHNSPIWLSLWTRGCMGFPGAVSLNILGGELAPKLVYLICAEKELLNFSEAAPTCFWHNQGQQIRRNTSNTTYLHALCGHVRFVLLIFAL